MAELNAGRYIVDYIVYHGEVRNVTVKEAHRNGSGKVTAELFGMDVGDVEDLHYLLSRVLKADK